MAKKDEKEVKRINLLSLGKIAALVSFIVGILMIIAILVLQKISASLPADLINMTAWSELSIGMLLIIPFWYAVIGFLWGIFIAFIYNSVARYIGGIKIELI